jgi:hypothetical protein
MNYELFIENQKSDIEKLIKGTIRISDIGFDKKAIGELSGFTDGFTIGPITKSDRKDLVADTALIDEIIIIMIIEVQFRYNVDLTGRLKWREMLQKTLDNTENESIKITESVIKKEDIKLNISEVLIKVDENGRISNDKLGNLKIIEKINTSGVFDFGEDDQDLSLLDEEFNEEIFKGAEELASELAIREELQNSNPNIGEPVPTNLPNLDFNNTSFIGKEWKSFNINTVLSEIEKTKHRPNSKFKESLKSILFWIKNDPLINDVREASYLLATGYAEAAYSLQIWEADYVCTGKGVPYGKNGPCEKALSYYRSTKGKKNYYELGVDPKGFPYFGRGLIQLTGESNYKKWGEKIGLGKSLLNDPDLALKPENSYKIAVAYLKENTFRYLKDPTLKRAGYTGLEAARRSVNGGVNGLSEVNSAYSDWLSIFTNKTQLLS